MLDIMNSLYSRVATGLSHKGIKKCSDWALKYRIMGNPFPGKWSFDHHPWAKEVMDNPAHKIVSRKAAQLAFTEVALNRCFYYMDILGISCLYLLPNKIPDASDFSVDRFDKALDLSPHLSNMFSNTKNIGLKKAGSTTFYLRGSNSRSQLKSIPVSFIVFDELDEMNSQNVTLALERQSGQLIKYLFYLSTPTVENHGIDAEYQLTTQSEFFITCPHCSERQTLRFPESMVITADDPTDPAILNTHLICTKCKGVLPHESKSEWMRLDNTEWVPAYRDRIIPGYTINQLYSHTLHPSMIADLYLKSLNNPTDEQEFYNSKLGMTHTVKGAKVFPKDVESCKGNYFKTDMRRNNNIITMGVDVGTFLHVNIEEWYADPKTGKSFDPNLAFFPVLINELKVKSFNELDKLMRDYQINHCVIDFQPETRKASEFAKRFYGKVTLCRYGDTRGKQISRREEDLIVDVNRTSWLDLSLSRFFSKRIKVPQDVSREYINGMGGTVRIYKKDKDDNPIGKWVKVDADHYAHARNYSEIALKLAVSKLKNESMTEVA